ncbi:MAG: FtsQ-type POTRA domain-containing protein, partial [Herpetosiphonaceae bacterium]|nr:FtsQ-type POTRA domain-containing protein [Herpetosiphonaceae bacterium]
GYIAQTSPRFTVQTVKAEGNRALTTEDVTRFAQATGQSIWFVHPNDIRGRIAESPYVETVKVRLQLPDAVVVTIAERQPDIRWLHDGQVFAVTSDGLVVDQVLPPAPAPKLPVAGQSLTQTGTLTASIPLSKTTALTATVPLSVTSPLSASAPVTTTTVPSRTFVSVVTIVDTTPNRPLKIKDHVDPDAVELARRVSLRSADLPQPITRIEWDAGLGVSLIMGEGHQVVLGNSREIDRKLATLRSVMKEGTQFTFFDLRPETPYYR